MGVTSRELYTGAHPGFSNRGGADVYISQAQNEAQIA